MASMLRHLRARVFKFTLELLAGRSSERQTGKNGSFIQSLRHAVSGILLTFLNERNFRFECFAAVVVVAAGVFFRISCLEWALVMTNVFMVLALEAKNTSLEITTDLITTDYDYNVKSSKDASSGGVLLAAIGSIFTGIFVFGPHLVYFIQQIVSK